MHRGYTKRWRRRWDKEYHKDHLLWVLMDYFIDHANYKDTEIYIKGAGLIPLKRGDHVFGTPSLAGLMGVDRQRVRSKLKILKKIGFLTIKTTNKFSIATVINYNTYNQQENQANQQTNQQLTSNQPATNQQLTTPNKDKKEKKVKKKIKKKFIPPTINDVIKFFLDNNYTKESAIKAWRYYDDGNWKDSTGKPVLNWKQKMRGVWFKSENESKVVYKTPEETPTPDYLKDFVANIGKKPKEV